jgi:hypothetical protein
VIDYVNCTLDIGVFTLGAYYGFSRIDPACEVVLGIKAFVNFGEGLKKYGFCSFFVEPVDDFFADLTIEESMNLLGVA